MSDADSPPRKRHDSWDLLTLTTNYDNLIASFEDLQARFVAQVLERHDVQEQLDIQTAEVEQIQTQLDEQIAENESLQHDCERFEKEGAYLKSLATSQSQRLSDLQTNPQHSTSQIDDMKSLIEDLMQHNEAASKKNARLVKQLEQRIEDLGCADHTQNLDHITVLQQHIAVLEQRIVEMRDGQDILGSTRDNPVVVDGSSSEPEDCKAEVANLRDQVALLQDRLAQCEAHRMSLYSEEPETHWEGDISRLEAEYREIEAKLSRSEYKLQHCGSEREQLERQVAHLKHHIEHLQERLSRMEEDEEKQDHDCAEKCKKYEAYTMQLKAELERKTIGMQKNRKAEEMERLSSEETQEDTI
ncbi:hypothetical protein ACN47E_007341 [Coniothyrium glycines]